MKKVISTIFCLLELMFNSYSQKNVYISMAENQEVPNWELTECGSSSFKLHDFLNQGKVVFVYYADTWCGICKDKAKVSMTSTILKNLMQKYPNKIQFLAAFDGPTDCNGVIKAKSDYGWGSEVKAFVDNTNQTSKFYTWGAPGNIIIDPVTKKAIYSTYNNDAPSGGLKALEEVLNGTYKILDEKVNLAYRKKLTILYPSEENEYEPTKCVNDGIVGSTAGPLGSPFGFIIDLGGAANITGFKSYFNELAGSSHVVSTSNSENGPWVDVPGTYNNSNREAKGLNINARFIRWTGSKCPISEFTVQGSMLPTANSAAYQIEKLLTISPNPASNRVNIDVRQELNASLELSIIDPMGKSILLPNPVSGVNTYDVSSFANGLYFIEAKVDGNVIGRTKLVVNNK